MSLCERICLNAPSPLLDTSPSPPNTHTLACPPNHFSFPWAASLGSGALGLCPEEGPVPTLCAPPGGWCPKGHPVSSVPVGQNPLGSVGAAGFLAGTQPSAIGNCKQESLRSFLARLRQAGREKWPPGMRVECLGGLLLSPTAQLPGGSQQGPEHVWGWCSP